MPPSVTPPSDVLAADPLGGYPFGFLCVREVRAPGTPVEVPPWFDDWFDRVPEPRHGLGYRARELAGHVGISADAVYAALYDARLEGLRATGRGWVIPRAAVRLWLLECAASNLFEIEPSFYWRIRKGVVLAECGPTEGRPMGSK